MAHNLEGSARRQAKPLTTDRLDLLTADLGDNQMSARHWMMTGLMAALLMASPAFAVDKSYTPVNTASSKVLSEPALNIPAEAELGRSMVSFTKRTVTPAIRSAAMVVGKEPGISFSVPAGVLYLRAVNPSGKFYEYTGDIGLISLGVALPNIRGGLYVPNDPTAPLYAYRFTAFGPSVRPVERVALEPTEFVQTGAVSFRVEFIYTGYANGVLSATYREFRDDMARPAFTQELKYDISQDKTIGFKGARIQVLSAGNVSIKYIVQRGFDDMVF